MSAAATKQAMEWAAGPGVAAAGRAVVADALHVVQVCAQAPVAQLPEPAPLVHEFGMHDRDLPRRTAEADESELQPEAERVAERYRYRPGFHV